MNVISTYIQHFSPQHQDIYSMLPPLICNKLGEPMYDTPFPQNQWLTRAVCLFLATATLVPVQQYDCIDICTWLVKVVVEYCRFTRCSKLFVFLFVFVLSGKCVVHHNCTIVVCCSYLLLYWSFLTCTQIVFLFVVVTANFLVPCMYLYFCFCICICVFLELVFSHLHPKCLSICCFHCQLPSFPAC